MNCILLPTEHFAAPYAYIKDAKQMAHIRNVLGLQVGDTLKIGQLGGNLGTAIIIDIMPNTIELSDIQLNSAPPAKLNLTVVLALPRPKVLRRLVMDMTVLGVKDIILINSYCTQKSYWQSPMLDRLDEFVFEGLQQGVDTIAPTISLQKRFKPFIEDDLSTLIASYNNNNNNNNNNNANNVQVIKSQAINTAASHVKRAIVAHPHSSMSLSQCLQQSASKSTLPNVVFIGSEGGWIDYELDLLTAYGCQAVNIGQRILRTEAAVNAIVGQWLIHA